MTTPRPVTRPVASSPIFAGPLLLGPQELCRAQFRAQLHINSFRLTIMIGDPYPVLTALRFEHNVLRQQLGADYLGLSLGGSLVRGLGTFKTSDVNYFIFTRSTSARRAEMIKLESRERLSAVHLTPGQDDPVCDLEPSRIDDLTGSLSVFTSQMIAAPSQTALEAAALALIGRAIAEEKVPAAEIVRLLMEKFIELSGSSPAYAAEKFMKNRAKEFMPAGLANSLSLDDKFMVEMRKIALPYMVARLRHSSCGFPRQVWNLF